MATTAIIAGVDRTDKFSAGSVKIRRNANKRASLNALLHAADSGYKPTKGQQILITDGASTRYFAGHIKRIVEKQPAGTSSLDFDIEARDFNQILSDRQVTATYELSGSPLTGWTLYDIVEHVNNNFLDGEGITLTGVTNPGPTIDVPLSFQNETVESVFNRLATLTGFVFFLDFNKVLYFSAFASNPAAFSITDTSANVLADSFEVERDDNEYRNRQHVRTEYPVAATYSETITAIAAQTIFITSRAISEVLSIKVNGVSKTFVALASGDPIPSGGYDFYYFLPEASSMGAGSFIALAISFGGGETVLIEYAGLSTNVVTVNDAAQQAARATLESGSGIHEAIEEQRYLPDFDTLEAIGEGRLRQFGVDAVKIRFKIDLTTPPTPGQRVSINRSIHAINADYLIESVDYEWLIGVSFFWRCSVHCTSVEPFGRATGYLERLVEMARIGPGATSVVESATATEVGGGVQGWDESPTGSGNVWTLAAEPSPPGSLILSRNGIGLRQGIDYSLSGKTITLVGTGLEAGSRLRAFYSWTWNYNNEVPTNTSPFGGIYTLAVAPSPALSLIFMVNGITQEPGIEYVLTTNSVDFVNAPDADDWVLAWYSDFTIGGFGFGEVPGGTVNGTNKVFTLAGSPTGLYLTLNGAIQAVGVDFERASDTITFTTAPPSGSYLRAWYKL